MRINNVDFTRLKDIDIVNILNNSSTSQDQRIILKRITLLFENNDEFINFFIVNSHLITVEYDYPDFSISLNTFL